MEHCEGHHQQVEKMEHCSDITMNMMSLEKEQNKNMIEGLPRNRRNVSGDY